MTETSIFRPHFSVTSLLMHDAIMNMSRFRPFVSFVIFSLPPSPLGTYHHHRLTDWLAGWGQGHRPFIRPPVGSVYS